VPPAPAVGLVSWAASPTAPFVMPAAVPPPAGPQGTTPVVRPPAVGVIRGGAVVMALGTDHCEVRTTRQCAGGEVEGVLWPAGRPAPDAPVRLSVSAFAYQPRFVASGEHAWIAWHEGARADEPPRILASARVTSTGFGPVHRLRLLPSTGVQLAPYDVPTVAAATNGRLRWYLPTISRTPHTLKTVLQSADGTFGKIATVTGAERFAKPALSGFATPAVGIVRDLVGWSNFDSAAAAADRQRVWIAEP
jgi:hypothetical protein